MHASTPRAPGILSDSDVIPPPVHGGRLRAAAAAYQRPLEQWLDLSTGINPDSWPVPAIPAQTFQRLPEDEDGLLAAARHYYQSSDLMAVAGSQAVIQALPRMRTGSRVGIISPAYQEHAYHWRQAGHQVVEISAAEVDSQLARLDVLIVINPNNPTGRCHNAVQLNHWHRQLVLRQGWLIIDEAFVDSQPQHSMLGNAARPGLIVLRSLGKFFGLAGIRCGFVQAESTLLQHLQRLLGPWALSGPTRYVATHALQDTAWQQHARQYLQQQGARLQETLLSWQQRYATTGTRLMAGTDYFQTLQCLSAAQAERLYQQLAQQGILTRCFAEHALLRFGLPATPAQWQRLEQTLASLSKER